MAETNGLDPVELNDVSTAVSEACNNVVLHAYGGEQGPLDVEIFGLSGALEVVVRDRGGGIEQHEVDHREMSSGIGLPVIRALSSAVAFTDLDDGGTEVRMRFESSRVRALELEEDGHSATSGEGSDAIPDYRDVLAFAIGPPALARAVLPRVLSALAVRAYFSTDRISDTQLFADALVAQAEGSISSSRLEVEVEVEPRTLQLRIGPLRDGHGEAVLRGVAEDGVGSVLERLSDGHEISRAGKAETLRLRLAERS